jgi:predicted nucleic acid-binding protein
MGLPQKPPLLVAVDANVALDLADGYEPVLDSITTIHHRLSGGVLCVPPTVILELAHAADFGDSIEKRKAAARFLRNHRNWNFHLIDFVPAGELQVSRIAQELRHKELIPHGEINDSLILAETALLGCSILLSSDEHLRGIDFQRLTLEMRAFDVAAPIVATPREIVKKFFR